ncbi:Protein N-terminal and lysine N-methyltransferase efm7 [Saitoella coloradoensis]
MSDTASDNGDAAFDMFREPSPPPPPPPTFTKYTHLSLPGEPINLRLVGSHPLWGHHLWHASQIFAQYILTQIPDIAGKSVLELGAGAGLPSLVAARAGAGRVVVTDYPDRDLMENLEYNVDANITGQHRRKIEVRGYVWGTDVTELCPPFDYLILSDLLFNHSQHEAMYRTCLRTLASHTHNPSAAVLVFYSSHRPKFAEKDLSFFDLFRERGWSVEEVVQDRTLGVMFEEDEGDEGVRGLVRGFVVRRLPGVEQLEKPRDD